MCIIEENTAESDEEVLSHLNVGFSMSEYGF
jgi:hypothetical protein